MLSLQFVDKIKTCLNNYDRNQFQKEIDQLIPQHTRSKWLTFIDANESSYFVGSNSEEMVILKLLKNSFGDDEDLFIKMLYSINPELLPWYGHGVGERRENTLQIFLVELMLRSHHPTSFYLNQFNLNVAKQYLSQRFLTEVELSRLIQNSENIFGLSNRDAFIQFKNYAKDYVYKDIPGYIHGIPEDCHKMMHAPIQYGLSELFCEFQSLIYPELDLPHLHLYSASAIGSGLSQRYSQEEVAFIHRYQDKATLKAFLSLETASIVKKLYCGPDNHSAAVLLGQMLNQQRRQADPILSFDEINNGFKAILQFFSLDKNSKEDLQEIYLLKEVIATLKAQHKYLEKQVERAQYAGEHKQTNARIDYEAASKRKISFFVKKPKATVKDTKELERSNKIQ